MDFSNAFDSVSHSLLICQLDQYGIKGPLLRWFTSYLYERQLCGYRWQTSELVTSNVRNTTGIPIWTRFGCLVH